MNKQKRNKLEESINYMTIAKNIIIEVKNKEEFDFDNLPENLQYSRRGCDMEEKIDDMDEVIDTINEIISQINDIKL